MLENHRVLTYNNMLPLIKRAVVMSVYTQVWKLGLNFVAG